MLELRAANPVPNRRHGSSLGGQQRRPCLDREVMQAAAEGSNSRTGAEDSHADPKVRDQALVFRRPPFLVFNSQEIGRMDSRRVVYRLTPAPRHAPWKWLPFFPNRERAAVAPSATTRAGLTISRSSSFHQRQRSIS